MKKHELIFFGISFFLVLLAFVFMQSTFMLSPDVSYLFHAANQLLAGDTYVTEIFETNPPMILYLMIPACWVAKWFSCSDTIAIRCYVAILASISLGVSISLLQRYLALFQNNKPSYLYGFYSAILLTFILLPVLSFGQREHLWVLLIFPYLLLSVLRIEQQAKNPWFALSIGTVAGLGFALKPYFLVPLGLIELLVICKTRKVFSFVRIEFVALCFVLILYLLTTVAWYPEYFTVILPLVSQYYFDLIKQPWREIIFSPNTLICYLMLLAYLFLYKIDKYKTLGLVLYVALLGMTIAFLIPRNNWYYHVLPAMILALILLAHCIGQLFVGLYKRETVISVSVIVILITIPIACYWRVSTYLWGVTGPSGAHKLAGFFDKINGEHSIYCMTIVGTRSCYPMFSHLPKTVIQGRFPSLWWYHQLNKLKNETKDPVVLQRCIKDEKFLVRAIADDLDRRQPRWVVVDSRDFASRDPFAVNHFFLSHPAFYQAWQKYSYITTIDYYQIYQRRSA